jgi:hypothetical protein
MKSKEEIENGLANFYGTEQYHKFSMLFSKHLITDGVKYLANTAECYWLLDIICSYHRKCMNDPKRMLQDFQVWTLTVKDGKGKVICERDTGDVAIKQIIESTNFPLSEIKLYVMPRGDGSYIILLPSEN